MDGSHHRAHAEDPEDPEEFLSAVIRGEITYVPPPDPEDAGVDLEEDLGADEDVNSWMNPSGGEGLGIDLDEGQTNNDDEGQINSDGQVYIY